LSRSKRTIDPTTGYGCDNNNNFNNIHYTDYATNQTKVPDFSHIIATSTDADSIGIDKESGEAETIGIFYAGEDPNGPIRSPMKNFKHSVTEVDAVGSDKANCASGALNDVEIPLSGEKQQLTSNRAHTETDC
jgi:hypothetical protein